MTSDTPQNISWTKRLLIIPPLLVAIAAVYFAPRFTPKAPTAPVEERVTKVRAISLTPIDVIPRAIGYGTVLPARSWNATAEVSGQIIYTSDALHNGNFVTQGTELLRIDPVDYELALAQITAQLAALAIKDETTRASLSIAERDFGIARDDVVRKQALVKKGVLPQATLETAQRLMLNSQAQLQNLKNALALNNAEQHVLQSQKSIAELNLTRTHLKAPFDLRITDVNAHAAQYTNKGQTLFTGDGIDQAEVEAAFPIGLLRPLIGAQTPKNGLPGVLSLNASIRLNTATHTVSWPARIDRVSSVIDPRTQSLGVVIVVDNPAQQAAPGQRPPLYRNTFVEAELTAQPIKSQLVVPSSAIHEGSVWLVNSDSRLETRPVSIAFRQGSFAVIQQGVTAGEKVITSDMVAAVDGMLLEAVEDKKTKQLLKREATGQEAKP